MDTAWSRLRTPWERLRWARLYWQRNAGGAETARAAAESLGMGENTYSAYERDPDKSSKSTPLDHQRAIQFGKKFKTNWVWLLSGEETPFTRSPAQMRVVEMMADLPDDVQDELVEYVEMVHRRRTG